MARWPGEFKLDVATTYIALGANLGDREATLREGVRQLSALGQVDAVSPLYETEPVGYTEQPPYLNAVARLNTSLSPPELLHALLRIEAGLGRVRTFANAPRTIDLDLLFVDDLVLNDAELTLPHPRLHERAFVLVPLTDIAPNLVHPGLRRTIAELLRTLPYRKGVRRWSDASLATVPGGVRPP